MPVRVKEPRQNLHKWTGTLEYDSGGTVGRTTFKYEGELIFIKTSRDAHFVSQGTFIAEAGMLSSTGDPLEAVRAIKPGRKIPPRIKIRILKELRKYKGAPKPIVEILRIDNAATPPLPKIFNAVTRGLFNDDDWLSQNGKLVGSDDIIVGRGLLPLPLKKRR